jgi:hypothetical protein
LLALSALPACPTTDPPPVVCTFPFVGDPAAPIELVPGASEGGQFVELHDGDALPLVTPPQGGHVSFVAARARNVDPCRVHISATLRSSRTTLIIAEESRDITLTPQPDGGAQPNSADISNDANVPLCPDYHDESIVDIDHTSRSARRHARTHARRMAVRTVVPRCLERPVPQRPLPLRGRTNYTPELCRPVRGRR